MQRLSIAISWPCEAPTDPAAVPTDPAAAAAAAAAGTAPQLALPGTIPGQDPQALAAAGHGVSRCLKVVNWKICEA